MYTSIPVPNGASSHSEPHPQAPPRGILRKPGSRDRSRSTSAPRVYHASPTYFADEVDYSGGKRYSVPSNPYHPRSTPPRRDRYASLPVPYHHQSIDMGREERERDRSAKACGQTPSPRLPHSFPLPHIPRHSLPDDLGDVLAVPISSSYPVSHYSTPPIVVPRRIIRKLRVMLKPMCHRPEDHLDYTDIKAMHKRDLIQRKLRALYREEIERDGGPLMTDTNKDLKVFGGSIVDVAMHASSVTVVGGFKHELPHVVFACVEELLRTGIYQQGLFRKLPNRERHVELIHLFNTAPHFGSSTSLHSETMPDICAVLSTYLTKLPEPILDMSLFRAIWAWSVKPSVKLENAQREQDEREDEQFQYIGRRRTRLSPHAAWQVAHQKSLRKLNLLDRNEEEIAREDFQITAAALLIRMLPCANLSLLVYLLAFFTQIPLCPENGIQYEDLARLYGYKILGGPSHNAAYKMLIWLLVRWPRISEKLGMEDECCQPREEETTPEDEEKSSAEEEDVPNEGTPEDPSPAAESLAPLTVPHPRKASDSSSGSNVSGSTATLAASDDELPRRSDDYDSDMDMLGEDTVVLLPSEGLFQSDKMSYQTAETASIYSTLSRSESSPALTALAKTLATGPPNDSSSEQQLTTTISLLQAEISQTELIDAHQRIQELERELTQKEKTTYATIQENFKVRDQVQALTERLAVVEEGGNVCVRSNSNEALKRKLEATVGERDKAQKLLGDIRKLIAGSPI